MSSKDLESASVRPLRLVSKLNSDKPQCLRERTLEFHHPLFPPSDDGALPHGYKISLFNVLPGGRYALLASICGIASIWDMGIRGNDATLVGWTQRPGKIRNLEFVSEGTSSSGYFIVAYNMPQTADRVNDQCVVFKVDLQMRRPRESLAGTPIDIPYHLRGTRCIPTLVSGELYVFWIHLDSIGIYKHSDSSWGALKAPSAGSETFVSVQAISHMGDILIAAWTHRAKCHCLVYAMPVLHSTWQMALKTAPSTPLRSELAPYQLMFSLQAAFAPFGKWGNPAWNKVMLHYEGSSSSSGVCVVESYHTIPAEVPTSTSNGPKRIPFPRCTDSLTVPRPANPLSAFAYHAVIERSVLQFHIDEEEDDDSLQLETTSPRDGSTKLLATLEMGRYLWSMDPWRAMLYHGLHEYAQGGTSRVDALKGEVRVLDFLDA